MRPERSEGQGPESLAGIYRVMPSEQTTRHAGGHDFAVLLPFACDFAIYSPHFKMAKHWVAFGGMGVRTYLK